MANPLGPNFNAYMNGRPLALKTTEPIKVPVFAAGPGPGAPGPGAAPGHMMSAERGAVYAGMQPQIAFVPAAAAAGPRPPISAERKAFMASAAAAQKKKGGKRKTRKTRKSRSKSTKK